MRRQVNAVVDWDGRDRHARNAKYYPDVSMEHARSLWNVNVCRDTQESFVKIVSSINRSMEERDLSERLDHFVHISAICAADCHQTRGYCRKPGECR